jgi:predicted secreted protein
MNHPCTFEVFVMIWFAVSVALAVIGNGAELSFFWAGTPGYLDNVYVKWCRTRGQSPNRWLLIFRVVSIISALIAGIFFILISQSGSRVIISK